VTHKQSVV